ncbi:MAG: ATP-grasp domain-containing protein [Methanomassiliicoccales archaeon]
MNLPEHYSKKLLHSKGVPIPNGYLIRKPDEIRDFPMPAILKAQVPIGRRGKLGGIRKVNDLVDAEKSACEIFKMRFNGFTPKEILVEEFVDAAMETYVGITINRDVGLPEVIASAEGGVEIEEVADSNIRRITVHPFIGITEYQIRELLDALDIPQDLRDAGRTLLRTLWELFWTFDCELLEINPLMITMDRRLVAADAKITINDDALFRHQQIGLLDMNVDTLEAEARKNSLVLVKLDGNVAVIANGAGLTMATLDNLVYHGGKGGLFLDLGGTDDPRKVECALELALKTLPKVILINIFGGMTRCDTVASGIIAVKRKTSLNIPIVIRLKGTNEGVAHEMLKKEGFLVYEELDEACKTASKMGGN